MSLAYRALVLLTELTDPSDTMNLIDTARAEALHLSTFAAERIVRKCEIVELDVHMTFTPASLALLCCNE